MTKGELKLAAYELAVAAVLEVSRDPANVLLAHLMEGSGDVDQDDIDGLRAEVEKIVVRLWVDAPKAIGKNEKLRPFIVAILGG